jgi:hypothetical protein
MYRFVKHWAKYLYLAPLVVCIVFLELFVRVEHKANVGAFEHIVAEKHSFFNKLLKLSPLFHMDDDLFVKIADGTADLSHINEYAFLPYTEIVSDIINDSYTFADLDVDSMELVTKYTGFQGVPLSDTTLTYYDEDVGLVKLFLYKTENGKYWLFGVTDGNMVKKQTAGLTILVVALLAVTGLINILLIYLWNKQVWLVKKFSKAAQLCIKKTNFDDVV